MIIWGRIKAEKCVGSKDWAVLEPLDFEFMSRDTLLHNCLVELALLFMAGKAWAMIGGAFVPEDLRAKVVLVVVACATQLDSLVMVDVNGKLATCNTHTFGVKDMWSQNLCIWRSTGAVTVGKYLKTADRGPTVMFVGYVDCESDSIRMWDPNTNRVVVMCDVIWLKCMHFQQKGNIGVLELRNLLSYLLQIQCLSSLEVMQNGAAFL